MREKLYNILDSSHLILSPTLIQVLFAFSFRTDEHDQLFWPLLLFLTIHILFMSILHFIFSDATTYWKESGCTKLSFFHYMLGNGLANVYIHNWIRMDPLLKPGMYTARYDYKLPGFTGCPNSSLCEFFFIFRNKTSPTCFYIGPSSGFWLGVFCGKRPFIG